MIIRRLPSFPRWSTPLSELETMRHEMGRLFDSLSGFAGPGPAGVFPPINAVETGEALVVRAELPGMKADKLDITVEDNTLTIAGEREMEREDENVSYHRREREWGTFRRSFSMPVRVDPEGVKARYVNGILTVELPKAAEARPKQIAVQAGS
jgi:HSP20 family protein